MKPRLVIILGAVLLIVVIVLAVFLFVANRNQGVTTNQKLLIWSPFDEGQTYEEMSQPFLEAHPDIEFEFEYIAAKDAKDYEAKVVDAIASGTGPDIWLLRNDWLAKHQTKLVPSTNFVRWGANTKSSTKDDAVAYFTESIFNQNARNNELYGFPLSFDSLALYINTSVTNQVRRELEDAGNANAELFSKKLLTWADAAALSRVITKKDSKGTISRAGLALGTVGNTYAPVDVFTAMLHQYGGDIFTSDEKQAGVHLTTVVNGRNQAPGLEALRLYSSFGQAGNANYSWNLSMGEVEKAFVDGKLAMFVGYSSAIQEFKKLNKDFTDYTVAPLPQVEDPEVTGKRVDFAAYWTHGVSKTSAKPDIAWTYLKSLNAQALKTYSRATGKPAFDSELAKVLNNASVDDNSLFASQIAYAPATYKPDWQAVDEIIQDMLNQALLTTSSLQAAIDSAAERLKTLLPNG